MLSWLPTLLQYQLVAFIDTGAHATTVAENIVSISYEEGGVPGGHFSSHSM